MPNYKYPFNSLAQRGVVVNFLSRLRDIFILLFALSFAVYCQVAFVPLKGINAGDFILYAVVLDNVRRGYIGSVIYLKKHFFLHLRCHAV